MRGRGALAARCLAVAVALAAGAFVSFGEIGSAAGATSSCGAGNCAGLALTASTASAGDSQPFSFTLTNEHANDDDGGPVAIGSAQVTAPAGFTITSASLPASAPPSATVFLAPNGASATFDNLGLAHGQSMSVQVTASAPCGNGVAAAYAWGVRMDQQSTFPGQPSEDPFYLASAGSAQLSGTLSGQCSLSFVAGGQPGSAAVGSTITDGVGSSGGPVQVEVLSATGRPVSLSTAPVTVGLSADPTGVALSGATTTAAAGGVATFSNLSLPAGAPGYQLSATSPGLGSGTSRFFTVYGSIQPCSGASCSASASSPTATVGVQASSVTPGGFLGIGFGGVDLSCSGYAAVTDPLNFDLLGPGGAALSGPGATATLEIPKAVVGSSGRRGASKWQICYASPTAFPALAGSAGTLQVGGTTYYTGLLLRCSPNQHGAPCIESRHKAKSGQVVIVLRVAGDPIFRG